MSEKVMAGGAESIQDESYGAAVTAKGLQLIAKIIATRINLTLSKVMLGSGTPAKGTYIGDLEDLVEPVTAGTVSEPIYHGDTVDMTVEYRSDMNGGLKEGFIIREFGIFARDPDVPDNEIMIFYGNLSKYPQYIAPYTGGRLDIRRYPVSITIAEGTVVVLEDLPSVVMTLDDVRDYCMTTMMPQLLSSTKALIDAHDEDEKAHPDIRLALKNTMTQVTQAVEAAKQEVSNALEGMSNALEETKKDVTKELAGSAGRFHIDFAAKDWNGGKLRFAREDHGLNPAAGISASFIRGLINGKMVPIWATWEENVHFDAQTGDLVLESEKPYAGDLLVLA